MAHSPAVGKGGRALGAGRIDRVSTQRLRQAATRKALTTCPLPNELSFLLLFFPPSARTRGLLLLAAMLLAQLHAASATKPARTFYFDFTRRSALDAELWCQANGNGHLCSVLDAVDQDFVNSVITTAAQGSDAHEHTMWIGLRRDSQEQPYYWLDGSPVSYLNFEVGEMSGPETEVSVSADLSATATPCAAGARASSVLPPPKRAGPMRCRSAHTTHTPPPLSTLLYLTFRFQFPRWPCTGPASGTRGAHARTQPAGTRAAASASAATARPSSMPRACV